MSKRHTFDLKLNSSQVKDIHSKYDILKPDQGVNTTNIELESVDSLCFLDDTRKSHKCILSRVDFSNPESYKCFWCHNACTEKQPIGCPIKYIPPVIHRNYFSEINKEKFVVKESFMKGDKIASAIEDLSIENNDYYETDGIFCDLPCALAFVRDNKKTPLYADSEILIHRIAGQKVDPAPHWRMLREYGGMLDIKDFREAAKYTEYHNFGVYKPFFKSIAHAFESKMRF
jgi:hypothetical protein